MKKWKIIRIIVIIELIAYVAFVAWALHIWVGSIGKTQPAYIFTTTNLLDGLALLTVPFLLGLAAGIVLFASPLFDRINALGNHLGKLQHEAKSLKEQYENTKRLRYDK